MKKTLSMITAIVIIASVIAGASIFSAYHLLGDVNDDENVDNKDVVALFRYVSGMESTVVEEYCDVNADGSIDNKDVTVLFRSTSTSAAGIGEDWHLGNYVDEFNEPTGEHYIFNLQRGTYTTAETKNGDLIGVFMVDDSYDMPAVYIILVKDNENRIVNDTLSDEPYTVKVKTSVGMVLDTTGKMYSGEDAVCIDLEASAILVNELLNGKDLTFLLKPDKSPASSYLVTVTASNFRAMFEMIDE